MQTVQEELADIDRRLDDAIEQLRAQQALVAMIDCERSNHGALLSLLSSDLEQFYRLQTHRKAILRSQLAT
jgi:hypothetical protein